MPTIVYIPFSIGTNQYISRIQKNLSEFGDLVRFIGFKTIFQEVRSRRFSRYDALVMNWAENDILDPITKRVSARATAKIYSKALLFRLIAKRTIFVRHNNYAHATAPESRRLAQRLMDIYEHLFSVVLTHSKAEAKKHRVYCPHPLYLPDASAPAPLHGLNLPNSYFVVFGQIAPYKHIRELMLAFPETNNLVIAGSVIDANYDSELRRIDRNNVYYRPGFLSESVAQAIMTGAKAAIIAHSDADMIVSGSFLYAISFGTPVIAVETPFFKWLKSYFGDSIVTTVSSLGEIAGQLNDFAQGRLSGDLMDKIEEHFGDATIRRTLTSVLQIHCTTQWG